MAFPSRDSESIVSESPLHLQHGTDVDVPARSGWISCSTQELESYIQRHVDLQDHMFALRIRDGDSPSLKRALSDFVGFFADDFGNFRPQYAHRTQSAHPPLGIQQMTSSVFLSRLWARWSRSSLRIMPETANLATICTDRGNDNSVFEEGLDFLPMPGQILESEVREPSALRLLKLRLLQRLKAQVWSKSQAECGNQSSPELAMRNTDLEASFRTISYRERHSVLDWTVDLMSGSWIQVVKGTMVYVAYHGSWSEEVQDQLCNRERKRFKPDQKDVQFVYLEPGDIFIIRPGTLQPTVYCSVTFEDTVATGGALWPEEPQRLLNNLRHMDFMICRREDKTKPKSRTKTDVLQESVLRLDIPDHLPEYLEALRGFIGLERRWFQGRNGRIEAYSESLQGARQALSSVGALPLLDH